MVEPGWLSLACHVLRNVPAMPDAACVQHRDLFDAVARFSTPGVIDRCVSICGGCSELDRCRSWARRMPALVGVFGGEHYPDTSKVKRERQDND